MNDIEKLKQLGTALRETAEAIDEAAELSEREDKGEDVQKELESALGRVLIKFMSIQSMAERLT